MAGATASSIPAAVAALEKLPSLKRGLVHASPSFRLRSSSLNTLRLRRVFDLFDHNGDSEITADELCLALDSLGLDVDPAELRFAVASYIPPGRIGLDFESFYSLHRALGDALFGADASVAIGGEEEEEEEMREAFGIFDEDADGYISAKELQAVLGKVGLAEGKCIDRVHVMIGSVDRNHDGRVDFLEFKAMMKSIDAQSYGS